MDERFVKLTNVAYRVLEFFPESDPLKNRAKDKVLAIMSALGESAPGKKNLISEDIEILLGYLWIAMCQGWLSSSNYLIISSEYKKIISGLNHKKEPIKEPGKDLNERQKKILDFLSSNEKGQVMDFIKVLPSVTKRTIRRDLDELLGSGQVSRQGEFNQIFYKIV